MFGSFSQCCSRSLPLTSDLLPTETNSEMPIPSSPARLISSIPRPPDCERNATGPRTGSTGANVAFMRTSGAVFTMPRQFGPITRMPLRRAVATMARSASLPLVPVSAKPAEMITTPNTCFCAHSSTTPGTRSAGTTTSATSTVSGTSRMLAYARTPATDTEVGLTGYTGPWKS